MIQNILYNQKVLNVLVTEEYVDVNEHVKIQFVRCNEHPDLNVIEFDVKFDNEHLGCIILNDTICDHCLDPQEEGINEETVFIDILTYLGLDDFILKYKEFNNMT